MFDKDIPIPPSKSGPGRRGKYGFRRMQVGESLAFNCPRDFERAKTCAYSLTARSDFRFTSRVTRNEDGSFAEGRIWRTE